MSEQVQALRQVLALTEQMLSHAQKEQWAELAELQLQRTPLLEMIFPLNPAVSAEEVRPILENVIELNQQVEQLCRAARQQIQTELSGFNQNKKAAAAYLAK